MTTTEFLRALPLFIAATVSVSGCDDKSSAGCTKDADCKGNRVCAAGSCVEPKAADAPSTAAATKAATETKEAPPSVAEAKGDAPPPSAAPEPHGGDAPAPTSCRVLLEHVTEVLRTTGSEATKAALKSPDEAIARCETQTNDPVLVKCFMDATTEAAVDACNLSAFPGEVDGTAARRVDGKNDNSALQPPIFTLDGDYMSWDADCGMLYREAPPAAALFVACNDTVKIGPIVTADKLKSVMAEISDASRSRHELVMGIIDNYPKGKLGVKVHVYDSDGTYRGIQER